MKIISNSCPTLNCSQNPKFTFASLNISSPSSPFSLSNTSGQKIETFEIIISHYVSTAQTYSRKFKVSGKSIVRQRVSCIAMGQGWERWELWKSIHPFISYNEVMRGWRCFQMLLWWGTPWKGRRSVAGLTGPLTIYQFTWQSNMQTGREHENSTQRGPNQPGCLNPGPSYC